MVYVYYWMLNSHMEWIRSGQELIGMLANTGAIDVLYYVPGGTPTSDLGQAC
jgi:hypothetical protein